MGFAAARACGASLPGCGASGGGQLRRSVRDSLAGIFGTEARASKLDLGVAGKQIEMLGFAAGQQCACRDRRARLRVAATGSCLCCVGELA